eukprot:571336-Amphidinium_carterae.1
MHGWSAACAVMHGWSAELVDVEGELWCLHVHDDHGEVKEGEGVREGLEQPRVREEDVVREGLEQPRVKEERVEREEKRERATRNSATRVK